MDQLSDKAKIIYATLDMLEAKGETNAVNAYTILNYIEENEELQEHNLLSDISEVEFVNLIMELNIKGVNTLIASMCRKELLGKTDAHITKVEGQRRKLRDYYIK